MACVRLLRVWKFSIYIYKNVYVVWIGAISSRVVIEDSTGVDLLVYPNPTKPGYIFRLRGREEGLGRAKKMMQEVIRDHEGGSVLAVAGERPLKRLVAPFAVHGSSVWDTHPSGLHSQGMMYSRMPIPGMPGMPGIHVYPPSMSQMFSCACPPYGLMPAMQYPGAPVPSGVQIPFGVQMHPLLSGFEGCPVVDSGVAVDVYEGDELVPRAKRMKVTGRHAGGSCGGIGASETSAVSSPGIKRSVPPVAFPVAKRAPRTRVDPSYGARSSVGVEKGNGGGHVGAGTGSGGGGVDSCIHVDDDDDDDDESWGPGWPCPVELKRGSTEGVLGYCRNNRYGDGTAGESSSRAPSGCRGGAARSWEPKTSSWRCRRPDGVSSSSLLPAKCVFWLPCGQEHLLCVWFQDDEQSRVLQDWQPSSSDHPRVRDDGDWKIYEDIHSALTDRCVALSLRVKDLPGLCVASTTEGWRAVGLASTSRMRNRAARLASAVTVALYYGRVRDQSSFSRLCEQAASSWSCG